MLERYAAGTYERTIVGIIFICPALGERNVPAGRLDGACVEQRSKALTAKVRIGALGLVAGVKLHSFARIGRPAIIGAPNLVRAIERASASSE